VLKLEDVLDSNTLSLWMTRKTRMTGQLLCEFGVHSPIICVNLTYTIFFFFSKLLSDLHRVFECDGVQLVVDDISYDFVKGATVDYEEELIRSAFVVSLNSGFSFATLNVLSKAPYFGCFSACYIRLFI
jgi:Fe-S cluster assembly iron-binding protein IscA